MYDEEFDWENPNYANQHPAHLINASLDGPFQADLVSWVEDYWLEIAQLAWNGYSEGYRGCVIASSRTAPADVRSFDNWLTDPRIPSFIGNRNVWYSPWLEERIPADLYKDSSLEYKIADYDPKAQLVIVFLDANRVCQAHFMAYCQDAYPVNARECSDKSLNHIIAKFGAKPE
jgi:hypothetical protein